MTAFQPYMQFSRRRGSIFSSSLPSGAGLLSLCQLLHLHSYVAHAIRTSVELSLSFGRRAVDSHQPDE
eukprot:509708-Amphidinium_carterae.1